MSTTQPMIDFEFRDEGTIVLFQPLTPQAREWWSENCADGMSFGGAFVVEHRYAMAILDGITGDGLTAVQS